MRHGWIARILAELEDDKFGGPRREVMDWVTRLLMATEWDTLPRKVGYLAYRLPTGGAYVQFECGVRRLAFCVMRPGGLDMRWAWGDGPHDWGGEVIGRDHAGRLKNKLYWLLDGVMDGRPSVTDEEPTGRQL